MLRGKRVLVVDDEQALRNFVARNLQARGAQVFMAANGLEALAIFDAEPLDLIVLDIMMPQMDGLETCRRIRLRSVTPIIILTALGEEADKVKALDQGADDVLTKPFGVEELLARVRALLRRTGWSAGDDAQRSVLHYRDLLLDPARGAVTCRNETLHLTKTEYNLLAYFMRHVGRTLPHSLILQQVWGQEYGGEAEYLRVYVGRLRRKIEVDPANPEYFFTEHGIGYRFG